MTAFGSDDERAMDDNLEEYGDGSMRNGDTGLDDSDLDDTDDMTSGGMGRADDRLSGTRMTDTDYDVDDREGSVGQQEDLGDADWTGRDDTV